MAKQQWEEDAKDRFLQFLSASTSEKWAVLDEDVVVHPATNRNFDYRLGLGERRMALELFRLVKDEAELARERVWSEVVHALERELAERSVKGYLLTTPSYFNVPKVKREQFAKQLADRVQEVIAASPEADELNFDGFALKRIEGLERIACSSFGEGGAVNPAGIALAALEDKLPHKNDQLAVKDHDRIVLVVNWTAFLVDPGDVVEAATQIDFARFPNIDRMFFEFTPGDIRLVFDRSVFAAYDKKSSVPGDLEPLYVQSLGFRMARHEPKAFQLIRKITEERGAALWIPANSRIEVVRYGRELAQSGDWDNAAWIVRTFEDDPDPSDNLTDPVGNCNYHNQIAHGETVNFIVTVRGHLCWLLQLIVAANKRDLYQHTLDIVERYALGPNLYIRQQATIPLIEFAKRRFTDLMDSSLADRIRALTLRMVRENAEYPAVLEGVANVVARTPDLTSSEAEEVLSIFLKKPDREAPQLLAFLLIYYAVFRERDNRFGTFDATNLGGLLMEQVVQGKPAIRSSILWRIHGILAERPAEVKSLLSYVAAFSAGSYDRNAFFHFYKILADCISDYPDVLVPALKEAFCRERDYVNSNGHEIIWSFDRQPWTVLRKLLDSGREEDFLDCIEIVLNYGSRIYNFPPEGLSMVVGQMASGRAKKLLEHARLLCAYFHWIARGRPLWHADVDWAWAEKQLPGT